MAEPTPEDSLAIFKLIGESLLKPESADALGALGAFVVMNAGVDHPILGGRSHYFKFITRDHAASTIYAWLDRVLEIRRDEHGNAVPK